MQRPPAGRTRRCSQFMRALIGLRQAGGRRGHRRGDRHRHDDAAALRLRLRLRRGAPGDAVRQPRAGAGVRLEPARAAADGQRAGGREAAARRAVHRRRRGRDAASPTRCCRPARSCACAPHRRALQRAAAGRRARDQAADAARRAAAVARDDRREGEGVRAAAAEPRSQGSLQRLLPEAQARLLASSERRPARRCGRPRFGHRAVARLKLALAPLLVVQAWGRGAVRRVLPEAAGRAKGFGRRRGRADARAHRRRFSAAGVGVAHQDQAVVGYLVRALQRAPRRPVEWACAPAPG